MLSTNCYLIEDEKSGEAAVIDPGAMTDELKTAVKNIGEGKLKYILLTHAHFDHILGVDEIKKLTGAQVAVHKGDVEMLSSSELSMASMLHVPAEQLPKADVILENNDVIEFGSLKFRVMHTPGHTKGSVCYICDDVIFSGDTLFCGSCGRTDFSGGSEKEILKSLRRLYQLDGDYKVYPGHNEETTLDWERASNYAMLRAMS